MRREVSWSAVAVVAAAVAVVVVCGYLLATWPPAPPSSGAAAAQSSAAPSVAAASSAASEESSAPAAEPTLAVLGDSFSGPGDSGPAWPTLLGGSLSWDVGVDAVDGSGYVSQGDGKAFPGRLQKVLRDSPDVVVVAGGYFDVRTHSVADTAAAADRLVGRLVAEAPDAQVVMVSPFSVGPPGPLTSELSVSLRQVAQRNGVEYVDTTGWLPADPSPLAGDGVHPTGDAERLIATKMEQALKRLGVVKAVS